MLNRSFTLLLASAALVILGCAVPSPSPSGQAPGDAAPKAFSESPAVTATVPVAVKDAVEFRLIPDGNEARYRVREQLAALALPTDAVGSTKKVSGSIWMTTDGAVVPGQPPINIDLQSLKSDDSRRDDFLRRSVLRTDRFPTVTFVPKETRGLTNPLPTTGNATFELLGDLTIRGVTRPATWQVTAQFNNAAVKGTATSSFTFGDFQIDKPRTFLVLTLEDLIRLEIDFQASRAL